LLTGQLDFPILKSLECSFVWNFSFLEWPIELIA
jgi:hypothetical protein